MLNKVLPFVILLCSPALLFSSDFLSFGGKIGVTNGWGYDQNTYVSALQPGIAAGMFVDFRVLKFVSLSVEGDYHQWTVKDLTRCDFVSSLFLVNFTIPSLKWRPVLSFGPRADILVNVAQPDLYRPWVNMDLSDENTLARGISVGLGVVSPRFHRFDFSLQIFFNSQLTQAGDIVPSGSTSGGGLLVPKTQTLDVFLSFAFHPLRDKK